MGLLDLLNGRRDTEKFLSSLEYSQLGTDLQALLRASKQWRNQDVIDVGESGTLYRFLQFAAWKTGRKVHFKTHGTLTGRAIENNPAITAMPLQQLLTLDNGTSQWASCAILMGNNEPPPTHLPFKLAVTYQALDHWRQARASGVRWEPRYDQTIKAQASAYYSWLTSGVMQFDPLQAEDYCFARAFDLIDATEGELRWPSLRQHESDRIASMELSLPLHIIDSRDHRVVQAIAMRKGSNVRFTHPESVDKSWPQFWNFMKACEHAIA